ncbi:MAG TPA: hypothetical protein VF695_11105 [Sphingomonas sp.]|jgi:hypothetical protein
MTAAHPHGPVEVVEADREAVRAFHQIMADRLMHDIKHGTNTLDAKGDNTDPIYQAFARHRVLGEQRAIARVVNVSRDVAFHAGVGGRETAGAIVSYLITSPDEIAPFVAGKLSPVDFASDWISGGCLSWHASGGKIVSPPKPANAIGEPSDVD